MKIYKVISIDVEKIWGAKKINKKVIGEVIKFEVNDQQGEANALAPPFGFLIIPY